MAGGGLLRLSYIASRLKYTATSLVWPNSASLPCCELWYIIERWQNREEHDSVSLMMTTECSEVKIVRHEAYSGVGANIKCLFRRAFACCI